ncbi:hypothetical protein BC941DRAFT_356217 [Chlamydoabsidia padenii]|nr:hypothetical protein BC941DRAFT_356217 [Chlamydoabsidia padenii]
MDHNQVLAAIAKGELYKCQIRVNQRDTRDAYGIAETLDDDIYIYGTSARNRALDGDVVAIRLLDVDDVWQERKENNKRAAEKRQRQRQQEKDQEHQEQEKLDEEVDSDNGDDDRKPKYAGEVVFILDRDEGITYTGVITTHRPGMADTKATTDIKHVWFKPTDRRIPLMMIDLRNAPSDIVSNASLYKKRIMEVAIIRWSPDHRVPFGKVVRCLGPIGVLAVEQQAILVDKNIMDVPFDHIVLKYVDTMPRSISAYEISKRRDLRHEQIFTIDPPTAKDLDDALHIKRLDDGCFEVGVHIADVTHYVKQNSLLDSEVEKRGTTTYLTNRSIPMLPPTLSEDLCSLNPGSDKLAFSVIWKLDQSGNIRDEWFGRTVIRSCTKLTYDEAQCVIDCGYLPEETVVMANNKQQVEESIMDLYKLSTVMRKRRYEEGALSLNSVKLSFTLDDQENPIGVSVYETKEANRLVEEFMLLANFCVAQKIYEAYPLMSLLRRHPRPIERQLEQFVDNAKKLGYNMNVDSAGDLQTSFENMNNLAVKDVLLLLAIQPMRRANYICSGVVRNNNYFHYALNQDYYTHFTSPIRRYADIIVHRLLDGAISGKEDCGYDTKMIQKIALHCNRKKDGAKNAQQADTMLFLADYLNIQQQTKGIQTEKAITIGVTKKKFDIYVPAYGLEYRVQLGALPLRQYEFNKGRLELYWKPGVQVDAVATVVQQCGDGITWSDHQAAQLVSGIMDTSLDNDYDDYEDEECEDNEDDDDTPRKIHSAPLNHDSCMQSIDTLATLYVNLIPDKSQPLTRIHVFPINPFLSLPAN